MSVKILMADGDRGVLDLARHSMSAQKWCDLVTVDDGCKAAEYLLKDQFDGLVTSDRLPNVDGFELIQRLKNSPLNARIPIVMLTAEGDLTAMRRGFKAGVTFFAPKPRNPERFYHLFNAIRGAMENERRRHLRLPYHTPVTCVRGDHRFAAESGDISVGGMSVEPSGGVEVGAVLELEFLLPSIPGPANPGVGKSEKANSSEREMALLRPQKVHAKVQHIAPEGASMGLDFLDLTTAQRQVIEHFISGDD
jgi:CheY-like chemotaxis protein